MTRLGVYNPLGLLHTTDHRDLVTIHIHKNGDLRQCDGGGRVPRKAHKTYFINE